MRPFATATLAIVALIFAWLLIMISLAPGAKANTVIGSQVVLSVAPGNYTPFTPVTVTGGTSSIVWTNPLNGVGKEIVLLKLAPSVGGSSDCGFVENGTATATNGFPLGGGFDWFPSADRVPSLYVSVYCPVTTIIVGSEGY